jgi:hypothetical protein
MAKSERNRCLSRSGIMAKSERDRWLSLKGWVAKFVARPLLWQLAGFESKHPFKIINCRHEQDRRRHTLARQKIHKKLLSNQSYRIYRDSF